MKSKKTRIVSFIGDLKYICSKIQSENFQESIQVQKQRPEVFCKKGVLRPEKRFRYRCFPYNFTKFLGTPPRAVVSAGSVFFSHTVLKETRTNDISVNISRFFLNYSEHIKGCFFHFVTLRSNHLQMFFKIGVFKMFCNIHRKAAVLESYI